MLQQDGSGDEWALASGRHFPHFLKVTWIYELPIGPGKAVDVDGVLGQIVGGWTLTGIHNYRSGSTLSVFDSRLNGAGYPLRPDVVEGVDQVIYDGSSVDLARGTPYLNPAAFATQPFTAQGIPARIGTAPAILLDTRGPAFYSEDFGLLKRVSAGGARSVEFRVDLINAFNRSGLAGPNTDLASVGLRARSRRGLGPAADFELLSRAEADSSAAASLLAPAALSGRRTQPFRLAAISRSCRTGWQLGGCGSGMRAE